MDNPRTYYIKVKAKNSNGAESDWSDIKTINIMAQNEIGSLVVTEKKKPVGIITERDLLSRVLATGKHAEATMVKLIISAMKRPK